jgi:hypothetical protein
MMKAKIAERRMNEMLAAESTLTKSLRKVMAGCLLPVASCQLHYCQAGGHRQLATGNRQLLS